MLIKLIALFLHEVVKEYQNLNGETEDKHIDESVLSFGSAISPGRTEEDITLSDGVLPLGDSGDIGPIIGFNHLTAADLKYVRDIIKNL